MSQFAIDGAPPPSPVRRVNIVRVTTAESHQFVACCHVPYGQDVHWVRGRTQECTKQRGECKGCLAGWPWKWLGYIHCLTGAGYREEVFLEVTSTCYHLLEAQLPDRNTWRGIQFTVRKTKGGAKGRYIAEVLERKIESEKLPEKKCPRQTLFLLWNAKRFPGQD